MREIFPGVLHWTALNENIDARVSSYYVEPAGVLIDPMLPDEGVRAVHVGVLSPDEYALHITAAEGALAIADGLNHDADSLGFFSDDLLGEDPEAVKEGLKQRFRTLLERDFEHLLFAHGDPIVGNGKTALRAFATG